MYFVFNYVAAQCEISETENESRNGMCRCDENPVYILTQSTIAIILQCQVKGHKSRNYNRSMNTALQPAFDVTCNLTNLLLTTYVQVYIYMYAYVCNFLEKAVNLIVRTFRRLFFVP
jgi:hypothetical protein